MLKVRNLLTQKRQYSIFFWRKKTENTEDDSKIIESPIFQEIEEEKKLKEEEIKEKQNKSRLNESDRNILFNKIPYKTPLIDYHKSLMYQRKMFGKYGDQSNLTASICWPTEEELKEKIEYETIAYPYKVSEVMEQHKIKVREEKEARVAHQKMILEKYTKIELWKDQLMKKIAKKEFEAAEAKKTKEKLIEEVRKHFGYKIDVNDEKFQEMLEKKQKELQKRKKLERKKEYELKLLELIESEKKQIQNKTDDPNDDEKESSAEN